MKFFTLIQISLVLVLIISVYTRKSKNKKRSFRDLGGSLNNLGNAVSNTAGSVANTADSVANNAANNLGNSSTNAVENVASNKGSTASTLNNNANSSGNGANNLNNQYTAAQSSSSNLSNGTTSSLGQTNNGAIIGSTPSTGATPTTLGSTPNKLNVSPTTLENNASTLGSTPSTIGSATNLGSNLTDSKASNSSTDPTYMAKEVLKNLAKKIKEDPELVQALGDPKTKYLIKKILKLVHSTAKIVAVSSNDASNASQKDAALESILENPNNADQLANKLRERREGLSSNKVKKRNKPSLRKNSRYSKKE